MPTVIPQWFTLNLCAIRDSHGSSLCDDLSWDGLHIFATLAGCEGKRKMMETRISKSLTSAWEWMMGKREYGLHDLRADIREIPRLFLTVPGDSAGIYTENQESYRGRGCPIGSHNMDNPAQALTALVGLAVFSEALEETWLDSEKILFGVYAGRLEP